MIQSMIYVFFFPDMQILILKYVNMYDVSSHPGRQARLLDSGATMRPREAGESPVLMDDH